jgi:AcrR family transcriptional regulator
MNEYSFMARTAAPARTARTTTQASADSPADKREQILAAALVLFSQRTFAGCPVPLIAEEAGVATGTIYRYFPSKEALVNALYQRWKGEMKRRLLDDRPEAEPADAREEFHRWWSALSGFVTDHPVAFEFLEMHHHESYLDDESRRIAAEVDVAALALAERGQATGEIRDLSAPLLVALVFGALSGVVRGMRAYGDLFDADALEQAEVAAWDLVRAAPTAPKTARKKQAPTRRPKRPGRAP